MLADDLRMIILDSEAGANIVALCHTLVDMSRTVCLALAEQLEVWSTCGHGFIRETSVASIPSYEIYRG